MRRAAQSAMLGAYRVLFARGLLRFAWGRRLFFALYEFYKSRFEAGLIDGLRSFAPPGALVIDVGANVGFFTLRFARWVGPQGRVIAIEPEAANHAELVRRLRANDLAARVETHRAVADAKGGTARLVINPDHPGDHRIGDDGEPISAVALDAVVADGASVSLIKIDVQGAEMRVLAGAAAILARDRPALFVEIDPAGLARFGAGVDALLGWLAGFGYAPHRLTRGGPEPYDRAALDRVLAERGYTDLLFLAARN
jgi:FkbM family methyltransferase